MLIAAGGSLLLARFGLALGFAFNALSYVIAAFCLWRAPRLGEGQQRRPQADFLRKLPGELWAGFAYLWQQPRLLEPLLLTFSTVTLTVPMTGLLAAIVQGRGAAGSFAGNSCRQHRRRRPGVVTAGKRDKGRSIAIPCLE
jgi:hypothetical protein